MKNNLLTLLKYKIINEFKLNKTKKKLNEKSTGDTIRKRLGIYVLVGAVIVFYVWIYFSQFYYTFKPLELQQYILPIFMIITSLLVFIYSIRLTENVLFKSRDYEMLSTLPIQPSTILSSKLIYILAINYFFSFLIMLPASIMLVSEEGLSLVYILIAFILIFFIPIIPIVLGALIAMGIGYISTKFKYTNLITTLLLIVFLLAFLFIPTTMTDNTITALTSGQLDNILQHTYYPAYMFKNIMQDMNIFNGIIYIIMNLAIFAGFVILIGKLYNYINQKLREKFKANKFMGKEYKVGSATNAMLFKELKKILTTPIYLFNSCFGMFILLGVSLFTFFTNDIGITKMLNNPDILMFRDGIIVIMLLIISAMSSTTGVSISLEGRNLWIYKTMPIQPKDVLHSKLFANLVLGLPIILIAAILFSIKFNLTLDVYILAMFVPAMFLIACALLGLLINLKYPVFEFENEVYVVKRSLSSMLSVMLPMFGSVILSVLTMFLPMSPVFSLMALGLVIGIINILMYRMLLTWGVKRFSTID